MQQRPQGGGGRGKTTGWSQRCDTGTLQLYKHYATILATRDKTRLLPHDGVFSIYQRTASILKQTNLVLYFFYKRLAITNTIESVLFLGKGTNTTKSIRDKVFFIITVIMITTNLR